MKKLYSHSIFRKKYGVFLHSNNFLTKVDHYLCYMHGNIFGLNHVLRLTCHITRTEHNIP